VERLEVRHETLLVPEEVGDDLGRLARVRHEDLEDVERFELDAVAFFQFDRF
jgi:hypothetical protein